MAPKKKEVQKFTWGGFLDSPLSGGGGSWADEVEDTYGTQQFPSTDRRPGGYSSYGGGGGGGGGSGGGGDYKGYSSVRDNLPTKLPDRPPFTAHLGNLAYAASDDVIKEFFANNECNVATVRIISDRDTGESKGFAYAEFTDLESLKTALTMDGHSLLERQIRVKVADPPRDKADGRSDIARDLSSWERKGPLADLPSARDGRRGGPDFGERRPREFQAADDGKVRDFGNWERKGPLSPLSQAERPTGSRDGSRPRSGDVGGQDAFTNNRRTSPAAWGAGDSRQDSARPPRREYVERTERPERPERPERVPTVAEKEINWRNNMRPDLAVKSPVQSREGSEAPSSPSAAPTAPAGRPKLNLAKRTVSEAPDISSPALSNPESKANPFGAARPIDTATREREIEEKRQQVLKEKKEADEKAKESVIKEVAEKAEAGIAPTTQGGEEAAARGAVTEAVTEVTAIPKERSIASSDSNVDQKAVPRPREGRDDSGAFQSRATGPASWRSATGDQRGDGGERGPTRGAPTGPRRGVPNRGGRGGGRPVRANGHGDGSAPTQQRLPSQTGGNDEPPPTPIKDEDGWTMVSTSKKVRGRPSV